MMKLSYYSFDQKRQHATCLMSGSFTCKIFKFKMRNYRIENFKLLRILRTKNNHLRKLSSSCFPYRLSSCGFFPIPETDRGVFYLKKKNNPIKTRLSSYPFDHDKLSISYDSSKSQKIEISFAYQENPKHIKRT